MAKLIVQDSRRKPLPVHVVVAGQPVLAGLADWSLPRRTTGGHAVSFSPFSPARGAGNRGTHTGGHPFHPFIRANDIPRKLG